MGKKLKTTAKVLMFIGVTVCLICAAVVLLNCYNRNGGFHMLQYATVNGGFTPFQPGPEWDWGWEEMGNDIYISIQIAVYLVIGALAFVVTCLPMYWFGCVLERLDAIEQKINSTNNNLPETIKPQNQIDAV